MAAHYSYYYIDGIPTFITLSQTMQNTRIIHQVPGSAEYIHFIKLHKMGMAVETIALAVSITDRR